MRLRNIAPLDYLIFKLYTIKKCQSNRQLVHLFNTIFCQDHTIKKLLYIFWEIVPKRDSSGKLLTEMILVCDAYRKVSYI